MINSLAESKAGTEVCENEAGVEEMESTSASLLEEFP